MSTLVFGVWEKANKRSYVHRILELNWKNGQLVFWSKGVLVRKVLISDLVSAQTLPASFSHLNEMAVLLKTASGTTYNFYMQSSHEAEFLTTTISRKYTWDQAKSELIHTMPMPELVSKKNEAVVQEAAVEEKGRVRWGSRHIVLVPGYLLIFQDSSERVPRKVVALVSLTRLQTPRKKGTHLNLWSLHRGHQFRFQDKAAVDRWYAALEAQAQLAGNMKDDKPAPTSA